MLKINYVLHAGDFYRILITCEIVADTINSGYVPGYVQKMEGNLYIYGQSVTILTLV